MFETTIAKLPDIHGSLDQRVIGHICPVTLDNVLRSLDRDVFRLTINAQIGDLPVYVGNVAAWSTEDHGNTPSVVSATLNSYLQYPSVKHTDNMQKALAEDYAYFKSLGKEFVHLDGISLDDTFHDERVFDFASHWNSPLVAVDKTATPTTDYQEFVDWLSTHSCYDKKRRYKIRQLAKQIQDEGIVVCDNGTVAQNPELANKASLDCALWLHKRFKSDNFTHALSQVLWATSNPKMRIVSVANKVDIAAFAFFEDRGGWLMFHCLVVNQNNRVNNVGAMAIAAALQMAYREKLNGVDPTADTDPYVVDDVDIYKRLFLNQGNTRYGILGITNCDGYYPPYYDFEHGWKTSQKFINRFGDWIHDEKV